MNSAELIKWLKKQGCTFEDHSGGSGHRNVYLGDKKTQIPIHGSRKELKNGTVHKIKKDLGLK
ncbi:MAG: type II toxin-antitoxin system HicA family toxin [Candidatus Halichondribacter symbioticus]